MFAGYTVDAITNGVHAETWATESFLQLYDHYIPGWRQDNFSLRYAFGIPKEEIWQSHAKAKKKLVQFVNQETNAGLDVDLLTLGFARRAAAYKRLDLVFTDVERLKQISAKVGPCRLSYAVKLHPQDSAGKEQIQRIFAPRNRFDRTSKSSILKITAWSLER